MPPGGFHACPRMPDLPLGFITGIGTIDQAAQQRMLILIDIEELMSGAEMGLVEQTLQ